MLIILSRTNFIQNVNLKLQPTAMHCFCQTLGLVLRLRVDFVLPLSQEEEEEQQEEQEQEPPTKIYQMGVY